MNFQMTPRDRRATSSIGKRDRVPKRFRPIFGLGDANVLARMVTRNLEVDGGPGLPRGSGFCCLGDSEGGREGGSCRERERDRGQYSVPRGTEQTSAGLGVRPWFPSER